MTKDHEKLKQGKSKSNCLETITVVQNNLRVNLHVQCISHGKVKFVIIINN